MVSLVMNHTVQSFCWNKGAGMGLLALAVALFVGVNIALGNMSVDWFAVGQKLYNDVAGLPSSAAQNIAAYTVLELRLPRVLTALCIGAVLSVAGCTMQALVRNPLADPGLIGISGGAAAVAAVTILFLPQLSAIVALPYTLTLTMSSFIGALAAVWLVISFAKTSTSISVATLVLAGVAINALSVAIIGLSSYVADDDALRQITYWTLGSLGGSTWPKTLALMAGTSLCLLLLLRLTTVLNLLALGEAEAYAMGVNVKQARRICLWTVALGVALATAMCGVISFVGLLVPHITRRLFGGDHQLLLPASALAGASLMLLADLISRLIVPPLEVPISIITSAIGAPYLLFLLRHTRLGGEHA